MSITDTSDEKKSPPIGGEVVIAKDLFAAQGKEL